MARVGGVWLRLLVRVEEIASDKGAYGHLLRAELDPGVADFEPQDLRVVPVQDRPDRSRCRRFGRGGQRDVEGPVVAGKSARNCAPWPRNTRPSGGPSRRAGGP